MNRLAFNDVQVLTGLINQLERAVDRQNAFDRTPAGIEAKAARQARFDAEAKKAADFSAARAAHLQSRRLRGY